MHGWGSLVLHGLSAGCMLSVDYPRDACLVWNIREHALTSADAGEISLTFLPLIFNLELLEGMVTIAASVTMVAPVTWVVYMSTS